MAIQYYKQNRLKQLQAFCFAARTGSISAAAGQMLLSQPAASLLVQALEKDLGRQLFARRGRRIQLTREGEILLQLALPVLEGFDSLAAVFHERCSNRLTGNLVISAEESTCIYLLPEIVKQFTKSYSQIRLRLINVPEMQALELIRSGEADIAVGPVSDMPDDIDYVSVFASETVLITPPGHPLAQAGRITLEDISAHDLILPPSSTSFRRIIDLVFQQKTLKYRVLMEAGGWEAIKKYVEAGLGISIISTICLTGKEKISKIALTDFFPGGNYGIILRHGQHISPAARRFIELIDRNVFDD